MIPKYQEVEIVFQEFPNEVTLAINLTGCPCACKGCHSPHLAEYVGTELNETVLDTLIAAHKEITCVGFMGGDAYPHEISDLAQYVKKTHPKLKVGWYSGRQHSVDVCPVKTGYFDYLKFGPYIKSKGPLNVKTTNQEMWAKIDGIWGNVTKVFWR